MSKLFHLRDGEWAPYSHPPVFVSHKCGGAFRIFASVPDGDPLIFEHVVRACLEEPLHLLYVLTTPRGEAEPGRYQSDHLSQDRFNHFIKRFGAFFQNDGRSSLWAHSSASNGTIVWDNHNYLFAYGVTECCCEVLRGLGFHSGTPSLPSPHEHHYRQEFDADAAAVLSWTDWTYSPLQPEDDP